MRELKKARYNYAIVSEIASPVSTFTNPKTTSLFIESNTHLQKILQCPALSILNIKDSAVQTIKGCSALCNLTIENNRGMQTLKNASVRKAILSECHNLKKVILDKVEYLQLSGMYSLESIKVPCARHVILSNMNLDSLPFHLFEAFPNMETLELDNVFGFSVEDIYGCSLHSLTIRTCSIDKISGLKNIDEFTIEDCHDIRTISNIGQVRLLTIVNCSKLKLVENLSDINTCRIERCDDLQYLFTIEAVKCSLLYCFGIVEVPYLQIQTLLFEKCPFLLKIDVSTYCRSLSIDNCYSFEELKFQEGSANAHIDLRIALVGNNNVYSISEWFARVLFVKDNNTLEDIKQVQNLHELVVVNCCELIKVSNLQASIVSIDQAPSLESISEVFCVSELNLIGCDSLSDIRIPLSNLTTVLIHDCIKAILTIDASYLTSLSLINCGMVIPFNIHPDCIALVENTNQLPNTCNTNALPIVSRMLKMIDAADTIMKCMHGYLVKKRYRNFINFKKTGRISDCVICHEMISISDSTFTKCNHMFHAHCLISWLQIKRSCPLCNAVI
jgi:Ring finger domain